MEWLSDISPLLMGYLMVARNGVLPSKKHKDALMKIEKVKKDPELEQFGRNYLKKLYSVDREFASTGQPTRLDRHK